MKIAPAVKKETGHIALGTAVGVAVMLVVFAVLGYFSAGVAVSGILGGAIAVADGQPEDRARKWMQFSYNMRMLLMVVWLIVALAVPFFNWVAALVPLLMPRLTIGVMQATGMYHKEKGDTLPLNEGGNAKE